MVLCEYFRAECLLYDPGLTRLNLKIHFKRVSSFVRKKHETEDQVACNLFSDTPV